MRTSGPDITISCRRRFNRAGWGRLGVLALWLGLLADRSAAQTLQDLFANRATTSATSDSINANNTAATVETDEPKHGGKTGGHSLWISWLAPANGVVRFRTESSGFDALLSAYQFTNVSGSTFLDLREVARADDSEGLEHESEIEFGVIAGERYEIAVDGYFGATGSFKLRWDFDSLPFAPPQILSTPGDRAVNFGDTVSLVVNVTNAAAGQFKWFLNGNELGVTTTNLDIASFQASNVGRYKLRVSANNVRFFSVPIEIQINTDGASNTLAQPKLLDAPGSPLIGTGGGSSLRRALSLVQGGGAVVLNLGVVRGYNGSQIFNTTYAVVDPNEPPHCGVAGGKSYWLVYQPPTNGVITLDTIGSGYDTVMEAYTFNGQIAGYQDLIPLDCANDSFGTNGPSRVQLPVVKSRQYLVVVDGVGGAYGTAWLNYSLNTNQLPQPPTLTNNPLPRIIATGSTITLTAPISGSAPLAFNWRKDGALLPGASSASLTLANVTTTNSGNYSFSVTNDLGNATGTFAIKVVVPPRCALTSSPSGWQLSFLTMTGANYIIEEALTIAGPWLPWPDNYPGDGQPLSLPLPEGDSRFFRVRVQ